MTQRDWQKDMDLVQGTIKHDAFPAWTEPMLYWLQEAKERGEREQRMKETITGLRKGIETLRNLDAGEVYLSEVQFSLGNLLALYPDTPAPREGSDEV